MQAYRKLNTTPPPSAQGQQGANQTPPAHPEGSNTLIILSALGALGGLYYYYARGQPGIDREAARRKEEEAERKVREIGDAGKNKVESIAKQGQRDYDQAKVGCTETPSMTILTTLCDRLRCRMRRLPHAPGRQRQAQT